MHFVCRKFKGCQSSQLSLRWIHKSEALFQNLREKFKPVQPAKGTRTDISLESWGPCGWDWPPQRACQCAVAEPNPSIHLPQCWGTELPCKSANIKSKNMFTISLIYFYLWKYCSFHSLSCLLPLLLTGCRKHRLLLKSLPHPEDHRWKASRRSKAPVQELNHQISFLVHHIGGGKLNFELL